MLLIVETIISSSPVLLLIAIGLEYLYPLPAKWQPLTFFAQVSGYLAQKVNHGSDYQRQLSGALLSIVMLSMAMLLLLLLDFISVFPSLFHLLLLFICLRGGMAWRSWQQVIKQLTAAQSHPFKQECAYQQCQDLLSPLMLRKLDGLSAYGLQKATLEALPQRLALHWFGVIFYFLLAGIKLTVLYVLLIALAQQFNNKQSHFQGFGLFSGQLYKLVAAPPLLLLSFTLLLYGPMRSALTIGIASAKTWHYWASGLFLGIISSNMAHSFGGPRVYPSGNINSKSKVLIKQRYPNIINIHDTNLLDLDKLKRGLTILRHSAQLWILTLLFSSLFLLYFELK